MKRLKILPALFFLLTVNNMYAAENEPNNNKVQANVLALNGSNTGSISTGTDEDWWQVTTNADGRLDVAFTVSNSKTLRCYLYDNDGTTLLSSGYSSSGTTVSKDGLATGTYYIKLIAFTAGQLPAYTVSNTLTLPAQDNDQDPNNNRAEAINLPQNSTTTGHAGYYYNVYRDTADWYKVTTNADGLLRVTLKPGNGETMRVYLYDNNGTTLLNSDYSSSVATINEDGLAPGTYYIKVFCFYSSDFAPYTLSDSLFVPAQANDQDPNNNRAEAINLPQNSTTTGHAGYYYNVYRDTADWYKLTTTADGLLRVTLKPANGQTMRVYLYDNDGTTLLNSAYSSSVATINEDGLAPGTYYVKVFCFYNYDFAPYTLSDSLFVPAQANDAEPDNNREQAKNLPPNSTKAGHAGYYYNLYRDTADWYKLTTTTDGSLRVTLKPANGETIRVYLYDNDGTTLLNSAYSSAVATINEDGLAPGTYYVKVFCFYSSDFAPYTLSDSLFTYNYTADKEPNKYASQAKTMPANENITGHAGFYYNHLRDSADWWRINYTGSGDLSFTINQETLFGGGTNTLRFQVYKDTVASAIHSSYSAAAGRVVNLTALTQGYYWIKVYPFNSSDFSSYSISNTFTQVNTATIHITSYDTTGSCASVNAITFKAARSNAPYTIQLYRFGVAYGIPVNTRKPFTFTDLPTGSYYATVYGDGATGSAFGKSKTISIEPITSGLNTSDIQSTKARLNWSSIDCAGYFMIQYKVHGANSWTKKNTTGNVSDYVLKGLTPNTQYDWRIAVADSANGIIATGVYADSTTFTTSGSLFAATTGDAEDKFSINSSKNILKISAAPNPATSYFIIGYTGSPKEQVEARLYSPDGKAVWASGLLNADALNGRRVMVNQFISGVYYLKIVDAKGFPVGSVKIAVTK